MYRCASLVSAPARRGCCSRTRKPETRGTVAARDTRHRFEMQHQSSSVFQTGTGLFSALLKGILDRCLNLLLVMPMTPLESLVACGTKLWLDSVDPDLVIENRQFGATGATSNPIIISDLIKTGRFDAELADLMKELPSDDDVAWQLTDKLVRRAQEVFCEGQRIDSRERRLRQLRARPAARRSGLQAVDRREGEALRRARQANGTRAA